MKQRTAVICLSMVNGGMELASVKLSKLLSTNIDIELICKKDSFIASKKNQLNELNIKTHEVSFRSNLSISLIKQIRDILIQRKIKNVIFLGASEMKSLFFSTRKLDINFIIRQGSKKTTSKKDFFHKLFYSNVKYFVGNCNYMKNNILKILPISRNATVKRIYSSLKFSKSITFKTINDTLDLVHVGRVHPGKGQLDAIKACSILHENNIKFKVRFLGDIQDKKYFNLISEYTSKLAYKDSIEFVGYTEKVNEYLEKSDVFIFPSLGEGMSNAIIEALGYGLITLIYNDTSSPEFKDLGFNIHLSQDNTVDDLRKRLYKISQNLKEEKRKAELNHKKAISIFSLDRERNEYLELLI